MKGIWVMPIMPVVHLALSRGNSVSDDAFVKHASRTTLMLQLTTAALMTARLYLEWRDEKKERDAADR